MCFFEHKDLRKKYKEGQTYRDEKGTIVYRIVFSHKKIVAMILKVPQVNGFIYEVVFDKWDSDSSINNEAKVTTEYYCLKSEIEHKADADKRMQMKTILLKSFCRAYLDDFKQEPSVYFLHSYEFLESCNANQKIEMLKNQIMFFICCSVVLGLIYLLNESLGVYVGAALSGLLGSFVMIFYGMNDINVSSYENATQLTWRYVSKMICGLIFGFFMLVIIKSNLIFSNAIDNMYGRCVFSFFAGMQAKWIPGIAGKFTSSN